MRTTANMTVKLGDLVVMAFDWAGQQSADPQEVQMLGTSAATYLLRRFSVTSPSRRTSGPLRLGPARKQLMLEDAGRRPGGLPLASG
jgi:hypothetical protein